MPTIQITFARDAATGQIQFDSSGNPIFGVNTGANTYAAMQARITNEVLGSPTAADIQNAIQDAIAEFERQTFWFNDMRTFGDVAGSASSLQTVAGKEFYSYHDLPVLVNMPHLRKIMVVAFQQRYVLISRTPQWMDDQSISPVWNGLPTDWCWQAGSVRLYPIPNDAYPLIIDGVIRFPPLSAGTDYNCWTNEAERLVRLEAKRLLFRDIIRDDAQTAAMEGEIYGNPMIGKQGALAQLRRESTRRSAGPTNIRPSRGYM